MPQHDTLPPQTQQTGYSLQTIHARVGGTLIGDPNTQITGVNALELAGPGQLTFAESDKYAAAVRNSRASAVIVSQTFPAMPHCALLRVDQPRLAFIHAMDVFEPKPSASSGIDRHAIVDPEVELGEGITIRACAVIRPHVRIGARTIIDSGAYLGDGVTIGEACSIGPNVVIMRDCHIGHRVILHPGTVIGADGFGYIWHEGRHKKIPQLGNVIIEDDVELGANVCVDRATFGSTIIRRGTKIDNLVQIAHNDLVGEHVIMAGQVGLAGSVQVGDRVMFGGQSGVIDHINVGDDARIGAGSKVTKDVRAGQTVWWYPARPIKKVQEELAALAFVPKLIKASHRLARKSRRK